MHFCCAAKILSILSPPHCSLNSLCVCHLLCEILSPTLNVCSPESQPNTQPLRLFLLSLPVIASLYFVYQCSFSACLFLLLLSVLPIT